MNSDLANSRVFNLNTKNCDRLELDRCFQKFACVLGRVRVWKPIAQRAPDFAIISVPSERLGIIQSPRPDRGLLQLKLIDHFP